MNNIDDLEIGTKKIIITDESGNAANITPDGKLKIDTNITVDSVSIGDVSLKDATNASQKLKVNADGSINANTVLTGSYVWLDSSVLRQLEKITTNRFDLYFQGKEFVNLVSDHIVGNATLVKTLGYVELNLGNNPANTARISCLSDNPINLPAIDKYSKLIVEYEMVSETQYNNRVHLHVRNTKNHAEATVGRESYITVSGEKGERRFAELDVSTLPAGSYYTSIGLLDESSVVSVGAKLRIYAIYLVKTESKSIFKTIDIDSGSPVVPSSVKDIDGNPVLRTVDAAPYAYDPVNDWKNVFVRGTRVTEIPIFTNEPPTAQPHIQSNHVDLRNIGGKKMLTVFNGWNVPVVVTIFQNYNGSAVGGGERTPTNNTFNPATTGYLSGANIDLLDLPVSMLIVRIKPTGTPTSGTLTAWFSGV